MITILKHTYYSVESPPDKYRRTHTTTSRVLLKVSDEDLARIDYFNLHGHWHPDFTPKKLGSNEYKRQHKRLRRIMKYL